VGRWRRQKVVMGVPDETPDGTAGSLRPLESFDLHRVIFDDEEAAAYSAAVRALCRLFDEAIFELLMAMAEEEGPTAEEVRRALEEDPDEDDWEDEWEEEEPDGLWPDLERPWPDPPG
jgi:hypothetical protein